MGSLRILVLYDRVLVDETEEQVAATEKSPVVRTLDKKEVEEEVADALTKLGTDIGGGGPTLRVRTSNGGVRITRK